MRSWKAKLVRAVNRVLHTHDIEIIRGADLWRPTAQLGRQPEPPPAVAPTIAPFLKVFQGSSTNLQDSFDFAVIIPTTLRATVHDALRSVFQQNFTGRVQILIGIDTLHGSAIAELEETCRHVPAQQCVFCFYPGYSTSRRHGGQHAAWDGGSLRTVLSYLANSKFLAYLDDDNWWAHDHLSSLHRTLTEPGVEWAYADRWFVHPGSRRVICQDVWESVGPGAGDFRHTHGGWVDPNQLALNKQICEAVLPWWSIPRRNSLTGMDADRNMFHILHQWFKGRATGHCSVFYVLSEADERHSSRLRRILAVAEKLEKQAK